MNILSANEISKAYADHVLLEKISFHIDAQDKIGVIGINGTGKSTLLKIIAGLEKPDSGEIIRSNQMRIEYLPQQPEFPENATVLEAVLHGHSPVLKLIRDYETVTEKLSLPMSETKQETLQKQWSQLSIQMEQQHAWQLDSEIKSILTRLGIYSFSQKMGTLSGGQKKRVALAAALVQPADLLILDEPTNHIDAQSIRWLEDYLTAYRGALLMVTHDRYFLERVSKVIFEIDRKNLFRSDANYSRWLILKEERLQQEEAAENKRQNLFRQELAWMRRGAKARSTKQQARIQRFEALKEITSPEQDKTVVMDGAAARLGKKTLSLEHISKSWPDKPDLIHDFSYIIDHRERLGIIGPNGCGKSTLLDLIAGTIKPDEGIIDKGQTVKIGYFTQDHDIQDPSLRVIDYIKEAAETIVTRQGERSASQMLDRFLFPPDIQWIPVGKLSGGEKRRLYLLKILMSTPNILLLDEPTNDLDIMTLAVLEDYLETFPGAVISVSHDRYYLDKVAQRILAFEDNQPLMQYEGNFQAYLEQRESRLDQLAENAPAYGQQQAKNAITSSDDQKAMPNKDSTSEAKQSDSLRSDNNAKKRRPVKLSYHEQREYESIDTKVAALEAKLEKIEQDLAACAHDYQKLQALSEKQKHTNAEYEETLQRWLYLNEKVEQMQEN